MRMELQERTFRVSDIQETPDDVSFELEGKRYFVDADIKNREDSLTFRVIRELNAVNERVNYQRLKSPAWGVKPQIA